MTETRKTVVQPYVRISYPVFEDEAVPNHAQEMNAFYHVLVETVQKASEEICRQKDGVRILSADYKTKIEGKQITVEYRITVRRRGRIECAKTLVHTWEDGVLIPPSGKKNVLFKTRGLLTRRRG